MAGIYIHIPFCIKKCNYCNFYISTCLNYIDELVNAEIKEIYLRKEYLGDSNIKTIYFGGGTPSLLNRNQIEIILESIYANFNVEKNTEITIECNPEDINYKKLNDFRELGINRLSIGIQTFNEHYLKLMNRSNNINDIYECVENIKRIGFKNYNLDLIYGIFNEDLEILNYDLEEFLKIKPTHISAYCLTIEDRTFFNYLKQKKKIKQNDDLHSEMFLYIDKILTNNGYIHYEISNYCLKNYESKHNTGYWNNKKYLGIGPSAHSYDGKSRQYNIENNHLYIISLQKNKIPYKVEILSENKKLNEYIFTRLRTNIGIDIEFLKKKYNYKLDFTFVSNIVKNNLAILKNNNLILTPNGMNICNAITRKLIV